MKNWKLVYKIIFWNCIAVIFVATMSGLFTGAAADFAIAFGVVCLICGGLDLIFGVIFLVSGVKEWAQGLLSCAGILLLLSGISCGTGLANLNFH